MGYQIVVSHGTLRVMITHKKPVIFREGSYTLADVEALKRAEPIWKVCDVYAEQLEELFEITHADKRQSPAFRQDMRVFVDARVTGFGGFGGNWVYYPWSGVLVHTVSEAEYAVLRTNRNRNLITEEEQEKLLNCPMGIVGLSVGSRIASTLAYGGIGNALKLAEYDTLETTNLNRIPARLDQIGEPKIEIVSRHVYEANPYASLVFFEQGLTTDTLEEFVCGAPAPKIIFEVIDNFVMKIQLRLAARRARIPVLMFANLGDSVLVDVERYDLDPETPLFNGRAGKTPEEILENPDITQAEKHRYAVELVGREHIPERAMQSVREIGRTLVGRPQLAGTVAITGGIAAYAAKCIVLGWPLTSGRYLVRFDNFFNT